ncbi:hypothetical protein, partial [Candidatus Igneacidithiobacillus taiwanensis]|uniref:hypothetical protein n=1 Tax=Candidatus Igneacidithiobacillus taiwanensis TaxID=1945924 RepID=UPI00289C7A6E
TTPNGHTIDSDRNHRYPSSSNIYHSAKGGGRIHWLVSAKRLILQFLEVMTPLQVWLLPTMAAFWLPLFFGCLRFSYVVV